MNIEGLGPESTEWGKKKLGPEKFFAPPANQQAGKKLLGPQKVFFLHSVLAGGLAWGLFPIRCLLVVD